MLLSNAHLDALGLVAQMVALGMYSGMSIRRGLHSYEVSEDDERYELKLAGFQFGYLLGWLLRLVVIFYLGTQTEIRIDLGARGGLVEAVRFSNHTIFQ